MSFAKFFAAQLRKPSGLFGRYYIVHHLNRRNENINTLALETLKLNTNDEVLEVGFGGGELIAKMAGIITDGHITGLDFSLDAVKVCRNRFSSLLRNGKIILQCADIEKIMLDSDKYHKVCTVNTIYFWSNPQLVLRQIHRVLKVNGKLVICIRPRSVMEKRPFTQHGFRLYEPEEVLALLKTAGFRDVRSIVGNDHVGQLAAIEGLK